MLRDGLQRRRWKVGTLSDLKSTTAHALPTVHAKKMVAARKIIAEGCEKCPKSEDVWFHAAELNVSGRKV